MCGIVGYVGEKQAQDVVIDGLRRLEYRGYDSAGIALVDDGTVSSQKRAGKLANLEKAIVDHPAGRLHDRHRAHPVGDPRGAQRRQRPPAPRPLRAGGAGAQRHHRELHGAAHRARGPGPRAGLGDRHRGGRAPARARARRGRRPDRRDAARVPAARGRVHAGRAGRRRPVPGGRGPAQLAAGGRARGGRELPRLRRRGVHRAHPRGDGARPGPGRHHHPRGGRGDRLRRHARRGRAATTSTGTCRPPRRTATTGSCARRSTSSRGRSPTRCSGGVRRRGAAARRDAALRRGAARHRQDHHHRLRDVVLRRPGRQVRHRALDAHPGRGRAGLGVPLPRPDPDRLDAGRRDQPVRRDRRHAAGDPARARCSAPGCWRSATPTARRSRASPTR